MHDKILILDFGSQVTQLIARRVREAHVYCEVHPNDVGDEFVRRFAPKAIILSGSHASTYEDHELRAPQAVCRPHRAVRNMARSGGSGSRSPSPDQGRAAGAAGRSARPWRRANGWRHADRG